MICLYITTAVICQVSNDNIAGGQSADKGGWKNWKKYYSQGENRISIS